MEKEITFDDFDTGIQGDEPLSIYLSLPDNELVKKEEF